MYHLNVFISFIFALIALPMLPMMGIFAGGGMVAPGSQHSYLMADTVMWLGILFGFGAFVLNIWGLVKYHKLEEGASTKQALLMMYSPVILGFLLFTSIFFIFES